MWTPTTAILQFSTPRTTPMLHTKEYLHPASRWTREEQDMNRIGLLDPAQSTRLVFCPLIACDASYAIENTVWV